MRCGIYLLVDVHDPAIKADEERPPRRKRLIFVHDAIGFGDLLRGIAQQREVDAQRLGKRLVHVRRVDANREIGDIECPDVIATLTE